MLHELFSSLTTYIRIQLNKLVPMIAKRNIFKWLSLAYIFCMDETCEPTDHESQFLYFEYRYNFKEIW